MLKGLLCIVFLFFLGDCTECPDGYTQVNTGCFLAAKYISSSWTNALDLCINFGGYLARIKSCSLLGDLVRYFHLHDLEAQVGYWIGATDEGIEADWSWSDGTQVPMGAPFWGWNSVNDSNWINEPNGGVSENCAMLVASDRYRFHDENCEKSGSPLCQADPLDLVSFVEAEIKDSRDSVEDYVDSDEYFCPVGDGCHGDEYNDNKALSCADDFELISGSCFHFDYDRVTNWNDAYKLCRDEYNNSHLAVLNSCDLFEGIVTLIRNNATYDLNADYLYWLGGTDADQEGHWYWINLEPMAMGPPFWGVTGDGRLEPSGNVSQNCANMYKKDQYYFHDADCETGGHALCQRDPE